MPPSRASPLASRLGQAPEHPRQPFAEPLHWPEFRGRRPRRASAGEGNRVSQSVSTAGALVRVSVMSEERRLDVAVAAGIPLIEVLPGFARSLGVLDATLVHGGYALRRADGSALDASLSAAGQGVRDGDVLTLVRGAHLAEPRVYDDVTEAVIDAASEHHRPWTPADNARTALAVSMAFLGLSALVLALAGPTMTLGVLVAGAGAVVLLVAAAVLGRLGQAEAGQAFGIAAAVFAAITGYLAVPAGNLWGWPLAAAAGGSVLAGIIALALRPSAPAVPLVPISWGLVIGIPALITGLAPGAGAAAYAVTLAVAGALGNVLPWLALSSTRIKAISPQSEQEIFADPAPLDAEQVKRRAVAGGRVLTGLRVGIGAALIAMTPAVASASVAGALLCTLVFLGLMFQARGVYARVGVLVVMVTGAVGLAVTGLVVAVGQPELRTALLIALLGATAVLVALTMLSPVTRLRLARLADSLELVVLVLLLPLGVIAAGWA